MPEELSPDTRIMILRRRVARIRRSPIPVVPGTNRRDESLPVPRSPSGSVLTVFSLFPLLRVLDVHQVEELRAEANPQRLGYTGSRATEDDPGRQD